ncbi:ComEC/Rec2 family competence protein [Microbacterium radiodurans]|uniref:MBL fold metallo-hydrolase n=1 Tax=Microbacterium radiodurans TaxID=661398 RepID=A0A5J5IR50_9MICO|nr:ComEC/Rec2 family competence protein [Microbacterium radiodurans]KAA9086790.1 MBL fold metallo-hydrolase [Microbacterium radiodurans]
MTARRAVTAARSGRRARRRDLRLLPVALGTWAAALVSTAAPGAAPGMAVAGWSAAATVTGLLLVGRSERAVAGRNATRGAPVVIVLVLAAVAAVASGVAAAEPVRARVSDLPIGGGRVLTVDAVVSGKVERSPSGWRFDAVSERAQAGQAVANAAVPIVVRSAERPDGLDLGSSVTISGTAFAAGPGERAVLVVDATASLEVTGAPTGVLAVAAELRSALVAEARSLPQPGGGLVAGMAVGETSGVSEDLDADMKTASLSHLTAVSGANCALIVVIAYGLVAACGARRGVRVATGGVALGAFVVLVTPEPSVVRAAAMAGIAMIALLLGRAGAGVSVLCLAVTVALVLDPWLAGSVGFGLSAAATAALLLFAGPMADRLGRVLPRPLALAVATSLSAQLAVMPLIITIDPRMPVYAVIANMLAAPAAPVATVLGLAACLAAPVPVLASGLSALAWIPCAWVAAIAGTAADLPFSSVPWVPGWGGAVLAALVCAAALAWLTLPVDTARRRWARAVVAVVVGVVTGSALLAGPITRANTPTDWAIVACDVGQGDAVLLRSAGRVALVDTGPDPDALGRCLDRFGVGVVDILVLTHFDLDHRGGVDAVVGRVGAVLHGPVSRGDDQSALAMLGGGGARVIPVAAGVSGTLGDARWRVLWPRERRNGIPAMATPPAESGNDASVVIDIRGGGIPATVLLGDLSEEPQRMLAAGARAIGTVDVVKVAHHGSADQFAELYRRIAPRIALVSVGENDYGHPRREILDVLIGAGAAVARTDRAGSVAVLASGPGPAGALRLWTEHPDGVGPDD